MSNLNIQQKVSLINQKTKENKVKESNLTDEQLRLNDYNENIKPTLPEDQTDLIQKYQTKLAILGDYKEVNIYDMVRKYDWNVKVLDDLTSVMIKKWEEAADTSDWKEVKRVVKPAVTKKAKEAEDVKRPRKNEAEELDVRDKSRNLKGGQRNFKEKARRGQSVDPTHGGYGNRYDQYDEYIGGQDVRHYKDDRTRRRDHVGGRGQKEIVMYVKKGEQENVKETHADKQGDAVQAKRKPSEEYQRKGRFEKVIYVKKNKDAGSAAETQETKQGRNQQETRGRGRQQRREENENAGDHGWQNEESFEEKQNNKAQAKENKPVTSSATKAATTSSAKKEAPVQNTESLSPVRHYNEHNIHEFFMIKDGKESAKKEARREPERAEEVSQAKPKEEKNQADHTSQAAQKPLADQPIGPNRTQTSSQNNQTATQTTQQTTQNAAPSSQATTQNATAQSPIAENAPQYVPQAYGFPQYPQQPYFMPQFPQQPMYNPYMYMPQVQPSKEQQQQQGSYPPGFNPQDMSSMFQVQYMLIPQPNGPPILQPIFPVMPQVVGMQRPAEGEQQKYAQPYYQFPVTMPNTPAEYYNNDDKKSRHQAYDNKQSATPNTGAFFNFSNNDSDLKKQQQHQGSYMPQQGGAYQFMPFMIPTGTMQGGIHPGQQHQGKQNDKSDFLFPNH